VLARTSIALLLLLTLGPASGSSSIVFPALPIPRQIDWVQPAHSWHPIRHKATFEAMQPSSQPSACAVEAPPEALTTPNPLAASPGALRLTVSFVVGTDGRVYGPLVLDGSKASLDHEVLDVVRRWRYRPALCNGAPIEAEARVEFSTVNSN
jgi:TonB family protein